MLNQHEVKVHNMKVALKEHNRKVDNIAAEPENKAKRADHTTELPQISPAARPARKIYMGGKSVKVRAGNVRCAMPAQNYIREYLRGERS